MKYRREVRELLAIYQLEPQLKDIYVEGVSDSYFIGWYLSKSKLLDVDIKIIDHIDIPDDMLEGYNLNLKSNRSRVIALSCELSKNNIKKSRLYALLILILTCI